jgi:hypothetical protein
MREFYLKLNEEELKRVVELIDYETSLIEEEVQVTNNNEEAFVLKEIIDELESLANKIDPTSSENILQEIQ